MSIIFRRIRLSRLMRLTVMVSAFCCALAATPVSAATSDSLTETSPANQLAIDLNTIGEASYSNTFAGVMPTDSTDVTLYTTGDASALISYADQLANGIVNISDETVDNSFATLNNSTNQIAASTSTLAEDGIALQSWGPMPDRNEINVTLAPSPAGLSGLSYVSTAQSTLNKIFGSGLIYVNSDIQPVTKSASRDNDTTPYTGGNGLFDPHLEVGCTDSWTVKNPSGDVRVLAAGHCGPDGQYINNDTAEIGTVQTQVVGSDYDYETISANEQAYIWNDSSTRYGVLGYADPPVGSLMAVNGDVSKQHVDQTVSAQDECVSVTDANYGSYIVCGMGEVSNSTTDICHHGDSGGPAYVRGAGGSNVYAAGTIESITSGGENCFFESVSHETDNSNLTLVTS